MNNNNLLKLFNGIPELNGMLDNKDMTIDQQQLCIHSLNMKIGELNTKIEELELTNEMLVDLVDGLHQSLLRIKNHLKKDCSHMWTGPIYQANYVIDEALKKTVEKNLGEKK